MWHPSPHSTRASHPETRVSAARPRIDWFGKLRPSTVFFYPWPSLASLVSLPLDPAAHRSIIPLKHRAPLFQSIRRCLLSRAQGPGLRLEFRFSHGTTPTVGIIDMSHPMGSLHWLTAAQLYYNLDSRPPIFCFFSSPDSISLVTHSLTGKPLIHP